MLSLISFRAIATFQFHYGLACCSTKLTSRCYLCAIIASHHDNKRFCHLDFKSFCSSDFELKHDFTLYSLASNLSERSSEDHGRSGNPDHGWTQEACSRTRSCPLEWTGSFLVKHGLDSIDTKSLVTFPRAYRLVMPYKSVLPNHLIHHFAALYILVPWWGWWWSKLIGNFNIKASKPILKLGPLQFWLCVTLR